MTSTPGRSAHERPRRGRPLVATNATRGRVLATAVTRARGPWGRLRGLIGRPPLAAGEALLLEPCSGIHTWFMGFAIDAVFLGRDGRVVAALGPIPPWRMTRIYPQAEAVLELPAGTVAATETRPGDTVLVTEEPGVTLAAPDGA